eukprot:TRINITY_DN611_c0_g1_i3.p1 TRINITY_DN611_c0_g1~~TRINITY_DN611_c0_g1_i3.p1  ORF type:complete len:466 (+),score=103.09 TRINITY_DN611_c0_g1_i3:174-1400(+)
MEPTAQTPTPAPGNIQKKKRSEIPCRADMNCKNPNCPYKHSVPRSLPGTSATPCVFFLQGYCREGAKCKFYHPPTENLASMAQTRPQAMPQETDEAKLREMAIKSMGLRKPRPEAPMPRSPIQATAAGPLVEPTAIPGTIDTGKVLTPDKPKEEAPVVKETPPAPKKFLLKRRTEVKKVVPEVKKVEGPTEETKKVEPPVPKGSKDSPIIVDEAELKAPEKKVEEKKEEGPKEEEPINSLLEMVDEDKLEAEGKAKKRERQEIASVDLHISKREKPDKEEEEVKTVELAKVQEVAEKPAVQEKMEVQEEPKPVEEKVSETVPEPTSLMVDEQIPPPAEILVQPEVPSTAVVEEMKEETVKEEEAKATEVKEIEASKEETKKMEITEEEPKKEEVKQKKRGSQERRSQK